MFKSPRDVLQFKTLCQQLGLGSQLKEWYQNAASVPYGPLLIGLTPKTVGSLRYRSNSGSVPTNIYYPAGRETKFLDNEYTIRLYSPNISKNFPETWKAFRKKSNLVRHFAEKQCEKSDAKLMKLTCLFCGTKGFSDCYRSAEHVLSPRCWERIRANQKPGLKRKLLSSTR